MLCFLTPAANTSTLTYLGPSALLLHVATPSVIVDRGPSACLTPAVHLREDPPHALHVLRYRPCSYFFRCGFSKCSFWSPRCWRALLLSITPLSFGVFETLLCVPAVWYFGCACSQLLNKTLRPFPTPRSSDSLARRSACSFR